jgi:hypothetical protein
VIVDAASPAKANMQWINCDPLRADAIEKVRGMSDGHGLAAVRNFGLAERRFGSFSSFTALQHWRPLLPHQETLHAQAARAPPTVP